MPLVGLVMFSLLFTVILLITIFIQYRIKKYYGDEDEIEDEDENENDKIDDEQDDEDEEYEIK